MSVHNAIRRKRTPQWNKFHERKRALRRRMRKRRIRTGLRHTDKRFTKRFERRRVRVTLRPIEASYHYIGHGDEMLKFRQAA